MRRSRPKRYKAYSWFLFLLLLSQFCSVVMAAKKNIEYSLPAAATTSSEYDAFLKAARFMPSAEQQRAVESLFSQLQRRQITIKPSLYRLLALADSDQLVPLSKKIALFFSHVDNTRIKNSGCFSSMVQKKKHIRDFIGQEDSAIAMLAAAPCLSSVTCMCNNRGCPDAGAVKTLLSWPCWQMKGEFDEQRFRSFTGMFSGKGLPKQQDVQAMLSWPVWQMSGQFNHELFRSFSSMFTGKGLPKEPEVKAVLAWPVWQVKGQFNHALFRAFSGMCHGKGLPKEQAVKAILAWPVWQVNGQFNYELFRSFSSMSNGRGLPIDTDVQAVLSWPCWQVNGQFNHELFRSFSGMFNGKGLPKEEGVKAILSWPVWLVDGQFNHELFRSFSSMFNGKGLPKEQAVKAILSWPIWQVDSVFNQELFRSFSSMFNGRGLPKEDEAQALLSWPVWQVKGQFNPALFRTFSSMFHCKGLPKEQAVKAIFSWPIWQLNGQFNHEIFRLICAMFNGKGLPCERDVAACMQWLEEEDSIDRATLRLMSRLFSGTFAGHTALGLPPVSRLRDCERRLVQLFNGTASDADQYASEIKQTALFLANKGGSNHLCWSECERFFRAYSGQLHTHDAEVVPTSTARALSLLHTVLLVQGGPGVRTFFAVNDQQGSASERDRQLALLSLPVPLELIAGAFDRVPPQSWCDYIYFGRKRVTAPDCGQWHEICDWRRAMPERMSNPCRQRDFIDMAAALPDNCKKRLMRKTAIEAVITLFPSVRILRTLASCDSPANVATLFGAALDYVQNKQYDAATLTTLLPALLRSGLTLPSSAPQAAPHGTFMNPQACDGGITVHCPADVADGETLLHSFVATFTAMASNMLTTFEGEHFTVEQYGGERFRFPVPKCVAGPHSFTISNWLLEHFKLFFGVPENSELYLANPTGQDGKEPYVSSCQQRLEAATTVTTCDCDNPFTPLPLSTLALIVKNSAPINRWVWQSFAHHRHRLPESVGQWLLSRAVDATDEVPAGFLDWLQSRYPSPQITQSLPPVAECSLATAVSPEQSPDPLWAALIHKPLLNEAELALLNSYHQQFSLEQLASVVERASLALPADTLQLWDARLTQAREQRSGGHPLLVDLDDDLYGLIMETTAP